MKRPGYRECLEWIALNDDCEWLKEQPSIPSVTICFVIDMFGVDQDKAIADLRRVVARVR